MNARRVSLVVLGWVAVAGLLAFRQARLEQLRTANRQLRLELAADRALPNAPPAAAATASVDPSALSAAEHLELLRLRGEMAGLRRDLGQDLAAGEGKAAGHPTNRVASSPRPSPPSAMAERGEAGSAGVGRDSTPRPSSSPARVLPEPEAMAQISRTAGWTNAFALGAALRAYIEDHEGSLPRGLAPLKGEGGADPTAGFELIRMGVLTGVERQFKLVAREVEPRQLPDGQWVRIYVQADARPCLAGPFATPDWAGFEELHDRLLRERIRRETKPRQ